MLEPRKLACLGAAFTMTFAAFVGPTATAAAVPDDNAKDRAHGTSVSLSGPDAQTVTFPGTVDSKCVLQFERKPDDCRVTRTVSLSEALPATADDLAGAPMVARNAAGDVGTASHAPAYCRTWEQAEGSGVWEERHIGKFCYNNRNVWVWNNDHYPYKDGYHYCNQGYGIGYDIVVTSCNLNKLWSSNYSSYYIQNWDRYQVHVIYKGIPIYFTHKMHANVWDFGRVDFHYDD